jgi:hypothetical protein
MRSQTLLSIVAVVALAATAQGQAPQGAWYGVPVPPGLGDPHRPIMDVSGVKLAPALVPAGEEKYQDLQGPRLRRDLETVINFSKAHRAAGNKMWGRITGLSSGSETVRWAGQQFQSAGLRDVQVQEFSATGSMWWPKSFEVRVLAHASAGAGSRDVVLESAMPTSGSEIPGGVLNAPVVYAGATTDAALPDVDVKGKIAVQHLRPARGAFSERGRTTERARELSKRGAVAVLNVVEQPGNMHVRDFSNCGAPCFNLGGADGKFLESVIERAGKAGSPGSVDGLRLQISLQAESMTGLKAHNAVGIVPGRRPDDAENVIVNAHADGWFDAAGDNGDGLAVLVALARHFARPENRPERTVVFVASAGHHGSGMNGPSNFVRMNPALTKKTVLVLNLEHIAQFYFRTDPWRLDNVEQPMGFGISNEAPYIAALGKRAMARYGFNLNPTFSSSTAGDLGGYAPLGVPRVQAIHSGPMYHTSGDVLETISVPGLERAARFYAYFVADVAQAARKDLQP